MDRAPVDPAAQDPIRVLVVDDQSMIRGGFAALLDAQEGIEVVGTAANGAGLTETVRTTRPDVVLMDIRMPQVGGLEATRAVLAMPGTQPKIIMLTTFDAEEYVFSALRAGASGFLLKDSTPEELVQAVRVVADGESLLAPRVTRALIADFVARPERAAGADLSMSVLTERELDVLRAVARGLSNREIAAELVMAEQTVKSHVSRILGKLALRDRAQLVVAAYESGLVRRGE
ncbi:response regulator transcription factor [Brachybacterium sp. sponge]|uniref:response regulator n=1 Tax=Brachybacterium sp. sponge TaxID=1775432 RepID=UPI0007A3E087|nr:response regulator transcription factor [Brachybacterium sp. sponge]